MLNKKLLLTLCVFLVLVSGCSEMNLPQELCEKPESFIVELHCDDFGEIKKIYVEYMSKSNVDILCFDEEERTCNCGKICIKKLTPIKINLEKEKCVEHTDNMTLIESDDNKAFFCYQVEEWCINKEYYNLDNYYCNYYDKYCCLKKELKTPCEKGEEGWVEGETHSFITGITTPVCRQKTIYDYSCEELKKAILLDKGMCINRIWGHLYVYDNSFIGCKKYYNQEQIYNIAIEKGCEI